MSSDSARTLFVTAVGLIVALVSIYDLYLVLGERWPAVFCSNLETPGVKIYTFTLFDIARFTLGLVAGLGVLFRQRYARIAMVVFFVVSIGVQIYNWASIVINDSFLIDQFGADPDFYSMAMTALLLGISAALVKCVFFGYCIFRFSTKAVIIEFSKP